MNLYKIADNLNILGHFLGKRDIDTLTNQALQNKYQISQTDMLILFGGSIPYGCDIAGNAIKNNMAKNFMIVGGEGHTTESLRNVIHNAYPKIDTKGKMEADIMCDYIKMRYDFHNILIENRSTNCGNNVTNALDVMKQNNLYPQNIIIVQDATMQRRMDAGFRKYIEKSKIKIINFASYRVNVIVKNNELTIEPTNIWGMWNIERYISLLMGEIPRLLDNANGYGPNGKNYIAHVDIPMDVLEAFEDLNKEYGNLVRAANPKYSKGLS